MTLLRIRSQCSLGLLTVVLCGVWCMVFAPSSAISAVYATKPVSGGHLNPALTLATTVSGHMHWVRTASQNAWCLPHVAAARSSHMAMRRA